MRDRELYRLVETGWIETRGQRMWRLREKQMNGCDWRHAMDKNDHLAVEAVTENDKKTVKVPESVYQYLLNGLQYGACFEEYVACAGYPIVWDVISKDINETLTLLRELYEVVNLPSAELVKACSAQADHLANELYAENEVLQDILSGKKELTSHGRVVMLTNHPLTTIVPDTEDYRDFWDVINDLDRSKYAEELRAV